MYSYLQEFITHPLNTTCYTYHEKERSRWRIVLLNTKLRTKRSAIFHSLDDVMFVRSQLADLGVYIRKSIN